MNRCPVSGFPVTSSPQWSKIDLGEDYFVSFQLIGDRILMTTPFGNSGKGGMKNLFEERANFLKSVGLLVKGYFEIKDYSKVTGKITKEGRQQFVEGMVKERYEGNLLGYWGFGASRFVKWGFNVGTKLNRMTFPIAIVENYETAIQNAVKIIKNNDLISTEEKYPRFTKDEWYLELDDFSVRFVTLGDEILLTESCGKFSKIHSEPYFKLHREVLKQMKMPSGHYYRIADWEKLKGTTLGGRKLYQDGQMKLGREFPCVFSIGFNLNKYMKAILNISRQFLSYPLIVAENFEESIEIIENKKIQMASQDGALSKNKLTPKTDLQGDVEIIKADPEKKKYTREEWALELDGLSCRYWHIKDDILFYEAKGNLQKDHLESLYGLYQGVIYQSGLAEKGYHYQIADWSNLGGSNWKARKEFIERFRKSYEKYPCKLYVVFGLGRFLRAVVSISRQFFPVPIEIAKNLEEAVAIIRKDKKQIPAIDAKGEDTNILKRNLSNIEVNQSINNLLGFMGEINWDHEGIKTQINPIEDSHPFSPLFDAVELIKQDFTITMQEKNKAEAILLEQNRFNKLRAEIWEKASDKSIGISKLIQELLDCLGPAFQLSRACFNEIKNPNQKKMYIKCIMEWCDENVKPSIGTKFPEFMVKHYFNKDFFMLTPETALEMIPKSLRYTAKPFISAIVKKENLEYTSVLPYKVNNKLEGWFTFDVCRNNKHKPKMNEEMKKIAHEMVNIVSNRVAQKQAEDALQKSYDEMEGRVKERTFELSEANKHLENALKKATDLTEQARAGTEAKSAFLANMSHEIRTPLNGIMGFSQIIADSKSVPLQEKKQAEQITIECKKLILLVNQVLDLAKVEAGKMELETRVFSLKNLIDDILSLFSPKAKEKNIRFTVSVSEDVPDILVGDDLRLRQVLINLIMNALKFTREGSVSLTINLNEPTNGDVSLIFRIIDTGIGIPHEKLELIFESFTQAENETTRLYGGTGLGTTISRKIVELMKGEIGAESELGNGSTFWFTVRLEKGTMELKQESMLGSDTKEFNFDGSRILVVDDYTVNQQIAKIHLESAACIVTLAENGIIALKKFKTGQFDLILMDVQMPKMDGYETTREIRKISGGMDIPIIGLSAKAFNKDREACFNAGMTDFLPKPLEKFQFLSMVEKWLSDRLETQCSYQRNGDLQLDSEIESKPDKNMTNNNESTPINYIKAVSEFGGDKELVDTILHQFIKDVEKQKILIFEAIKQGDGDTIRKEFHKIYGGAANLVAMPLAEVSKKLEELAESGILTGVDILVDKFDKEFNNLKKFINEK